MSRYDTFVFKDYDFNKEDKSLKLYYGFDNELDFCETYRFDFDFVDYDQIALDRALDFLFFMAGVSYYKAYPVSQIVIKKGQVDAALSKFLNKTYQKGLGEYFYINGLDPRTEIDFPINGPDFTPVEVKSSGGKLVGIGGGKDSLVSYEILKDQAQVATWSLNHKSQLTPLAERIGSKHFWVERELDKLLIDLNSQDALNGHIPISAIFSCVGLVISILSGYRDNVVSNESSASEATLIYDGVEVNHQYSKSLEYEKDFQELLSKSYGQSLRYYSLLRPFSELRICEIFSKDSFDKYKEVFSSCNRAYRHNEHELFWCGECPKCAFVFLALTPFIDRAKLENLWHGKNLLLDPAMQPTYMQLLGIEGDKPLDCVGEIKEARAAMKLAKKIYPELDKYVFDIPEGYDYKNWSEHSMPEEIFNLLRSKVNF